MIPSAIFFDRDGTLNYDYGYVRDPNLIKLLPGVNEGLTLLRKKFSKIPFIVITNQAGVARGLMSMEQVEIINSTINSLIQDENAKINKFYSCPFHPEFSDKSDLNCRKPNPYFLYQAKKEFEIVLEKSFFIGDRNHDILAGKSVGCKTILLKSDVYLNEEEILSELKQPADFVAENFLEAINFIINQSPMEEN